MKTMHLGRTGPRISAIGLGAMGMTPGMYGAADRAESIATLHAALAAGARRRDRLAEALGALKVTLDDKMLPRSSRPSRRAQRPAIAIPRR